MAGNGKVLINLATGMEDGERVLISFLVATAAQQQGKQVRVWATKEAVRLGLPGEMQGSSATAARHSSVSGSSSSKGAASSGPVRSVSTPAISARRSASRTPK